MRKMYSSLKAEVASIDRKRKRLKKKRGVFQFFSSPFYQESKRVLILRTLYEFFIIFQFSQESNSEINGNASLIEIISKCNSLSMLMAMGFETYGMNSNMLYLSVVLQKQPKLKRFMRYINLYRRPRHHHMPYPLQASLL